MYCVGNAGKRGNVGESLSLCWSKRIDEVRLFSQLCLVQLKVAASTLGLASILPP